MPFDHLKQSIQENDNHEPPDMHNWYDLISDIHNLVPESMMWPKWKGYIKKSARILFCREVCQDDTITSFKDMDSGQLWEIHKWLNEDDINCIDVGSWFQENAQEIYNYAPFVKSAKLKADKARRDAKKSVPF